MVDLQHDCIIVSVINTHGTFKLLFQPSRDDRGWVVDVGAFTYWWLILLALVPAVLATILIFLDQQITAVIVNRKDHMLKVLTTDILKCDFNSMTICTIGSTTHSY